MTDRTPEPEPPVLTPTIVEPRDKLLPAIREDLAPFMPALRGAAQLVAVAAVTEIAARYAAPAVISKARQAILPQSKQKQTVHIEEQTTVHRRITISS